MNLISKCLLNTYSYTYKLAHSHSSSEKLITGGYQGISQHTDSQQAKVQRITVCGMLKHKWDIRTTPPPPKAQATLWKKRYKDCKIQRSGRAGMTQFLDIYKAGALMNTLQLWLPVQDLNKIKPVHISARARRGSWDPIPSWELLVVDWGGKVHFLQGCGLS